MRNSPPNKSITKYGDVIDRINRMLESSPEPVEIKDIFTHLVAVGVFQDTLNEYQKLGTIISGHIATGIRGPRRLWILKAHRLVLYQSVYIKYLWGEVSLEYLNERLNKLIELGIKPKKMRS